MPAFNSPSVSWLKNYLPGASITELEIECQIRKLDTTNRYEKAFFYFRDADFLRHVPDFALSHFVDENESSRVRLAQLKTKIMSLPFEVFNGYKCDWLKLEEANNRALVTNLDAFAHRVFNNLFNSIYNHHKDDIRSVELNEMIHHTNLNEAYVNACAESFIGRDKVLRQFSKLITEHGFTELAVTSTESSKELINQKNSLINIFLVNGEAGSGKTSFLCYFMKHFKSVVKHSFSHVVGSYESSEHVLMFLKRFCVKINLEYGFGGEFSDEELQNATDLNYFKAVFAKMLKLLSDKITNDKFYVVLDGVDMLVDENKKPDCSFSWIPENVPARISFIFTARSSNNQIKSILGKIASSYNSGLGKANIPYLNLQYYGKTESLCKLRSQIINFIKFLAFKAFII